MEWERSSSKICTKWTLIKHPVFVRNSGLRVSIVNGHHPNWIHRFRLYVGMKGEDYYDSFEYRRECGSLLEAQAVALRCAEFILAESV